MGEKEPSTKKKPPKGCLIGCFGIVVVLLLIGIIGSQFSSNENVSGTKQEPVEGIDVKMAIAFNDIILDEAKVVVTITNTTEKSFFGNVKLGHSSFKSWGYDVENLPPKKEIVREFKTKFIKYPNDEYWYSVTGELADSLYDSGIDFEVFETEVSSSFDVKTDVVNEDIAKKIILELYSKHGPLTYVGIYDKSQSVGDHNILPRAQYFGHVEQNITFYNDDNTSEKVDFDPSNK